MVLVILSLGDSYTIGEGVPPGERWPVQLVALLREGGMAVADPMVVARTGWTAEELRTAVDGAGEALTSQAPFPLVTLLVGVNDQYRGGSAGEFRLPYRRILERGVGFAGGDPRRVLVPSIPDWGATPFAAGRDRQAIAMEIDAFNGVVGEEVERVGAQFVDLTPLSRTVDGDPALLAGDGLHYSGTMYRLWAQRILPAARRVLEG